MVLCGGIWFYIMGYGYLSWDMVIYHGIWFYVMGYCGSGVSFSAQAGKRLAEKVAGKLVPNLPLYSKALPKFPFAPLRRVGQWGYFHYGKIKDNYF